MQSCGGWRWMAATATSASRSSITSTATSAKTARLGQAKEETESEIAEYHAQMEADFRGSSLSDSGANVKRLEQETNLKIEQPNQQAANISLEVIQMLLSYNSGDDYNHERTWTHLGGKYNSSDDYNQLGVMLLRSKHVLKQMERSVLGVIGSLRI